MLQDTQNIQVFALIFKFFVIEIDDDYQRNLGRFFEAFLSIQIVD